MTRSRSRRVFFVSVRAGLLTAVVLLLSGCVSAEPMPAPLPEPEPIPPVVAEPGLQAQTIAQDLTAPWSIAFVGDTALISQRDDGTILELLPNGAGAVGEIRIVGTIQNVTSGGEGGLLGIASFKDANQKDYLYSYFTAGEENVVERFELFGSPGTYSLGDAESILTSIPSAGNHNGGRIAFGPDGMLYVTTGDAGMQDSAQDLTRLSGKILRLTPTGGIPLDNPFPGSIVFSFGHRNPQGIAWDSDGIMYASEFGQNTWDELNVIAAGGNYGWPIVEGIADRQEFTDPVLQWKPSEASPSGIAIQDGTIYVANLRGERLREVAILNLDLKISEENSSKSHLIGDYGRLRDVVVAPDGSLWVLTNNTDGRGTPEPGDDRILRITF